MTYTLPVKVNKGNGPKLVFLHGLGNNHKSWSYVLQNLNVAHQQAIVVDLLGFGDAPKPELDYSPKDHARAVVATLDRLDLDEVILVGHSMGCIVALEVASICPNAVKGLVLFGAPIYKQPPEKKWWKKILHPEGRYFALFEIVKKNPDAVKAGGFIANELVPFVKGMEINDKIWPAYKASLENTIMQYKTYALTKKLNTPTLFVNGVLDFFIIRSNIHEIRRSNKEYIKIKNVIGPHELTPRQGRVASRVIEHFVKRLQIKKDK